MTSTAHPGPAANWGTAADVGTAAGFPSEAGSEGYIHPYPYPIQEPGRVVKFVQRVGLKMPEWAAPAGVALCVAGGVAYTLLLNPTISGAESSPTCIMKLLTGFDCPGCGGTRAAWYMLHGDFAAAARNHPMLVFATPFLMYIYVAWTLQTVFGRKIIPQLKLSTPVIGGFIGAWIVFSVLRNLPWAPFTWLYV